MSACRRGEAASSSRVTGRPSASAIGSRQFGYWSQVPGGSAGGGRRPRPAARRRPCGPGCAAGSGGRRGSRPPPMTSAAARAGSRPSRASSAEPLPRVGRGLGPLLLQRGGSTGPGRSRSSTWSPVRRAAVDGRSWVVAVARQSARQRSGGSGRPVAVPVPLEPQHGGAEHPAPRSASRTPGSTVPRSSPMTSGPGAVRLQGEDGEHRLGVVADVRALGGRAALAGPTRAGTGP